ncbi:MAG: hypothetical protein WB808_06385 [Candidatus Dormiibacterota bacterium]
MTDFPTPSVPLDGVTVSVSLGVPTTAHVIAAPFEDFGFDNVT